MATKELLAQLKLRKDTAASWTEKNPVIGNGEMIIVETSSGEQRFKVGDGEKTFTQLPYTDETLLSKIKTYSAGDGIAISNEGVISSDSDVFVVELDPGFSTVYSSYDDIKSAIENKKTLVGCFDFAGADRGNSDPQAVSMTYCFPMIGSYQGSQAIILILQCWGTEYIYSALKEEGSTEEPVWVVDESSIPYFLQSNLSNSGVVYYNSISNHWEIKDITSGSSSSADELCATITLGEKNAAKSVGEWVLVYPGTVTNGVTYDQALAAFNSNTPVKLRVTSNKEVTSNGNTVTIPIVSEAYMTRYIAAQNVLIFDYMHNATDLSVSSGGVTWTSDGTITCYTATYSFAFDATDTSASNVSVPTVTKVQSMIDTAVSNISGGASEYTIQVSNAAPATGTSNKIITYVVEDA